MAADAVAVKGAAPSICYLAAAQSGPASNMMLGLASLSQATLMINQLVDPVTTQLQPVSISLSLNSICNAVRTFAMQSTELRPAVKQRRDAQLLQPRGLQCKRSMRRIEQRLALIRQIMVAAGGANGLPLLAGTYADTITITFKSEM